MFASIVAIAASCSCDPIAVEDAYRFGVCHGVAQCNRASCTLHLENVVKSFDNQDAKMAWWWRQDQVFAAWDCLCQALDNERHPSKRLESLARLRVLIGAESYDAGRLPPAIPDYGVWKPVK